MLDKMPVIQINCSQLQERRLLVNGRQYSIVRRGFLIKQHLVLDADKRVWLTVKRRGVNAFRLQFASGHKYQLEVLAYTTTAYVFYDQEDTEIFRLTLLSNSFDTVCLLVSVEDIPEEEFVGLVVWGFYCWRSAMEKRESYKPAA